MGKQRKEPIIRAEPFIVSDNDSVARFKDLSKGYLTQENFYECMTFWVQPVLNAPERYPDVLVILAQQQQKDVEMLQGLEKKGDILGVRMFSSIVTRNYDKAWFVYNHELDAINGKLSKKGSIKGIKSRKIEASEDREYLRRNLNNAVKEYLKRKPKASLSEIARNLRSSKKYDFSGYSVRTLRRKIGDVKKLA